MGFDSNRSGSDSTRMEVEEDPYLSTWIRPCLVGRKFSVFFFQTFRKQGKRV